MLRSEVESLIASHDQAGDSIEAIAAEAATEMLANEDAIGGKQIGHHKVLNRIGRGAAPVIVNLGGGPDRTRADRD